MPNDSTEQAHNSTQRSLSGAGTKNVAQLKQKWKSLGQSMPDWQKAIWLLKDYSGTTNFAPNSALLSFGARIIKGRWGSNYSDIIHTIVSDYVLGLKKYPNDAAYPNEDRNITSIVAKLESAFQKIENSKCLELFHKTYQDAEVDRLDGLAAVLYVITKKQKKEAQKNIANLSELSESNQGNSDTTYKAKFQKIQFLNSKQRTWEYLLYQIRQNDLASIEKIFNGRCAFSDYAPLDISIILEKSTTVELYSPQPKTTSFERFHELDSPTELAFLLGHHEILQWMYRNVVLPHYQASADCEQYYGYSFLHVSALFGDIDQVKILLKEGADINQANKFGVTPLILAILYNHMDVVRVLLESGANVNAGHNLGSTALQLAAKKGDLELTKLLFENNADVHLGWGGAISTACLKGYIEIAQFLLLNGADPNHATYGRGKRPLTIACEYGHIKIVQLLLEAGADVNRRDPLGYTGLECAIDGAHFDIVEVLETAGAEVDCERLSERLVYSSYCRSVKVVNALLERGADPNYIQNTITIVNQTPLLQAIVKGDLEIVEALLEKGAKVEPGHGEFREPLILASRKGNAKIVLALLAKHYGSHSYPINFWEKARHLADINNHPHIVFLLDCAIALEAAREKNNTLGRRLSAVLKVLNPHGKETLSISSHLEQFGIVSQRQKQAKPIIYFELANLFMKNGSPQECRTILEQNKVLFSINQHDLIFDLLLTETLNSGMDEQNSEVNNNNNNNVIAKMN